MPPSAFLSWFTIDISDMLIENDNIARYVSWQRLHVITPLHIWWTSAAFMENTRTNRRTPICELLYNNQDISINHGQILSSNSAGAGLGQFEIHTNWQAVHGNRFICYEYVGYMTTKPGFTLFTDYWLFNPLSFWKCWLELILLWSVN